VSTDINVRRAIGSPETRFSFLLIEVKVAPILACLLALMYLRLRTILEERHDSITHPADVTGSAGMSMQAPGSLP